MLGTLPLEMRRNVPCLFDAGAHSVGFLRRVTWSIGTYTNRITVRDGHTREWLGNHESIPGFQSPTPARGCPHRHHGGMSTLRDDERARRHGMRRTTRAVYGHREIEPRLEFATRVEQGACGATRRGPAHEAKAERARHARNDFTVAMFRDDHGHVPIPMRPQ